MTIDNNEKINDYFYNQICNFNESTILNPNLSNDKNSGKLDEVNFEIYNNFNDFCKKHSISEEDLFLAATILSLNKFNFTDETLIYHGNNIPFSIKLEDRNLTVNEYLNTIHNNYKQNSEYVDESIPQLLEKYNLQPQFYFSFNQNNVNDNYLNKISITSSLEKTLLTFYFNNKLYSKDYVELFLKSIENILNQFITDNPDNIKICDITLEKDDKEYNFKEVELPIIHKRFERQVEKDPHYTALVSEDATLTSGELNQKANRIANALIKRGIKPKSNILLMLPRNSNLIAAILGILKAGCTYVPIDPEYPQERIKYIYNNSQADYIIASQTYDMSLDIKELLDEENITNPNIEVSPEDTAYMIYTSGSTGNPKGVMISHKNISNQVQNPKSQYNSLLCLTTVSFDVSVDDILTSLSNGLKLIMASDTQIKNIPELIELIKDEKPEVSDITPSRLASYLEVPEFCKAIQCLKCLFIGGEQFSTNVYETFRKYSDAVVYNSYGPTETTITSNNKEVTDVNDITVGTPLENYVTDVRDIDGKLLPCGVMGELYIGGFGVGKGYYNMPEKTKDAFLTINDIPYYRSGDYAIELPNGEIDIQGRIDNQIKLRGLRIEIGEIQSNILKFPNIKQAVVVIKQINNNEHLCAYFTASEDIDIKLLKRYLQSKLTKYMVPTVFIQLEEIPQTPNGKTDIKALPDASLALNYEEPETETEKKLYELVSTITTAEEFGITDDLYTIGFSSLTLMKLNSMIYNQCGVNINISDLFNKPTIKSLSDIIDNNIEANVDIDEFIKKSQTMDTFPLTANQLGIYYECMQTDKIKYNLPSVIRFGSDIDPSKLKQAIIDSIEAHPYMKTRIVTTDDGQLRQKRCDDIEVEDIEIVEVDSISNNEIMENDIKFIPIENNQLFKFKIYKTPTETVLFNDIHHIITDGVSIDLFYVDVVNAYNGKSLNKEMVDAFTYSLIEEELSENEVSKKYYDKKFAQGYESTILTPNLNGNPDEGNIKLIGDRLNSNFVRLFCQDHSISPNVLFMSAVIVALNKFTYNTKTLITTIFNGRSNPNYYNTQGMLVKTLPIMIDSENRKMMVEDFIELVDENWKNGLIHSNMPYIKLSEDYQLKPEFFYAYHGAFETDNLKLNGNYYKLVDLDGTVETDYKINLDVYDDGEDIGIYLEYNDQLYTKEYVTKFLNAIKYILTQFFVNDMDKLMLEDIELAPKIELPEFTQLNNPLLHKRFEVQVDEKRDDKALVTRDDSLTYGELNDRANRIANSLIKKGVQPRSNILITLPRNSNLIASILGVLKAGCAFIPLDLKFPKERIEYIYKNSQADYIINIDGTTPNSLSIEELLEDENNNNPNIDIKPDDLAYMIYTSGSTGKPKGVMISHENACNETQANPKCEYDNLLSIATIAFDTSLEDILTGLTNGIKIIFANDDEIINIMELTKLIEDEKPEVMEFTPSRLLTYLEYEEFCNAIGCAKCIVMGGEQFSTKAYNAVKQYTNARVYNSYGPTEATIASNYKEITDTNNITIGKPLDNYVTEVRDIDGKLLPQEVIGELYIGGVGVGKGYYNMPDKTSQAFLTIDDIPYYRSGDYALETIDGEIEIKGRIDNQIKLRGLRIEIGEIESNIANYPDIKQVAVVIKKISKNDHLCAYFTAEDKIDTDKLKQYLKDKLTEYMIPTVFIQLDVMPVTPNGKTDTKALPEIDEQSLKVEYAAPTTPAEQIIVEAFEEVFNQKIGIHDDFTVLGGDSLTSIKVTSLLASKNITLSPSVVLNNKTPENIAKILEQEFKYLPTLARKGTKNQNMFIIPPLSGTSLAYSTFIPRLEFEGNIYVLDDFKYLLSIEEMQKTDSSMAVEKYYEAIMEVFQDDDIIVSYSQGCIYAVMITSMLEKAGKVCKCILIDGDLEFKETEMVSKEGALGLVTTVISSRFDLDESNPIQLDQLSSEQLAQLLPEELTAMIPDALDVFVKKIIIISFINSVWNFEPVTLDSHVVYLSTEPKYEDFSKYAHNFEYISIEADHLKLMDSDADKIIKYIK